MEKLIEDLLVKRVIVENLWPGCLLEVGDILLADEYGNYDHDGVGYKKSQVEPFPYLMRPLAWWENREVKDMPLYVRHINGDVIHELIIESENHKGVPLIRVLNGGLWPIDLFIPATLQEYNEYINSKK